LEVIRSCVLVTNVPYPTGYPIPSHHITHHTLHACSEWAVGKSQLCSQIAAQRNAMQCEYVSGKKCWNGFGTFQGSEIPRCQDPRPQDWTGLDWTGPDTKTKTPPGAISLAKWNTTLHAYWRTASWRPGVFVASAKCSTLQLETNVQCCAGAQLKKNRGVPYRAERAVPPLRFQMHMH